MIKFKCVLLILINSKIVNIIFYNKLPKLIEDVYFNWY